MKRHILSILLVLALVLTSLAPIGISADEAYGATTFSDISDHWAKSYIEKAVQKGFVKGYPDGTFLPEKAVSRAEFIKMVNSAIGNTGKASINFTDVPSNEWFYSDICKAVSASYVSGYTDGSFLPNASISRQEAAVIISRIIPGDSKSANLSKYKDYSSISDWAKDSLSVVCGNGYMGAYDDGLLHPADKLTRAQTAKIICEILDNETIITSNTTVKTDGTKLSGKIYANNVTVSKDLADGDATIDNCIILGSLIVQGGGENSVTVNNSRVAQSSVEKASGTVSLKLKGNTVIVNMTAAKEADIVAATYSASSYGIVQHLNLAGSSDVSLSGYFPEVNINGTSADLELEASSSIKALNVKGKGAEISLDKKSSVTTATADAQCEFTGEGTISTLVANASGITYETKPGKITGNGITTSDTSSALECTLTPKNGADDVDVDSVIKITFNNPVTKYNGDAVTATNLTSLVSLKKSKSTGSNVSFKASINSKGTVITITPKSSLDEDTKYYVVIDKNTFKDSKGNGNAAVSSYFTTDDDSTTGDMKFTPKNGATGVSVDVEPTIKFTTAITDYDGDKVTDDYIEDNIVFKKGSSSGSSVKFTASYSKNTKTITITPKSSLSKNTKYYLSVPSKTFKDDDGDAIKGQSVTFTVGKAGPELDDTSYSSDASSVTIKTTASEAGTVYGVILDRNSKTPSASNIINGKNASGTKAKDKDSCEVTKAGKTATLEFAGLDSGTEYTCFFVLKTSSDTSEVYSRDVKTTKPTAYLSSLSVTGCESMSPSFKQDTTNYTVTMPYGTTAATIYASGPLKGEVTYNVGTASKQFLENGKCTIALNTTGTTEMTIYVKESEKADTTYKLTFKISGNTGVKSVSVNDDEISYSSTLNAYCKTVENNVTSASVEITPTDSNAVVRIDGSLGNKYNVSSLKVGDNSLNFTVTSNGDTKAYKIVIIREQAEEPDPTPAPTPGDSSTDGGSSSTDGGTSSDGGSSSTEGGTSSGDDSSSTEGGTSSDGDSSTTEGGTSSGGDSSTTDGGTSTDGGASNTDGGSSSGE